MCSGCESEFTGTADERMAQWIAKMEASERADKAYFRTPEALAAIEAARPYAPLRPEKDMETILRSRANRKALKAERLAAERGNA